MGGKTRIVDQISAIMRARGRARPVYVEPFMGGGSVAAAMAPLFPRAYLSDANEDLILMWQALQTGWDPPRSVSREQWQDLKKATEPSALRAFAGFGASFGGHWFKSYAENDKENDYIGASRRALLRYRPRLAHAGISHRDYTEAGALITDEAVVYCDPPYAGTDDYDAVGRFDSASFWRTVRTWSGTGAAVFVSEYTAPEDFTPVWQLKAHVTINNKGSNRSTRTEQLFMHTPALERMRS